MAWEYSEEYLIEQTAIDLFFGCLGLVQLWLFQQVILLEKVLSL